jgi:protein-histidine pros-kinase
MLFDQDNLPAEDIFRELLESAPDAMVIVERNGSMVLVNSQTEKLFGYEAGELTGKPIEQLVPRRFREVHPCYRDKFFAEPHMRPMAARLDLCGVRRDNGEFPVEISLSPLRIKEQLFAICSIRDVTERKRYQQALQEKNEQLESANRVKDRFLAGMSHELRTPLNAIIGFAGTLLMRLPGQLTRTQEQHLQMIEASAHHLLWLVNNLLDLAKIESGKVELRREPISCHSLINDVVATLSPLAESKGIALDSRIQSDDVIVRGDRQALTQIVLNLTNNAIKFTDSGSVVIEVKQLNGRRRSTTELHVRDSGIGIRREDHERIFQGFERINGKSPASGGGLGLHLSRKLARLLGGEITLESEYGKGSTFTLALPDAP